MRAIQGGITAARGAGLVLALVLLIPAAPAFAQWGNYRGYQSYPAYPSYYAYPAYPSYPGAYAYPGAPPVPGHRGRRPYAYGAPFYEDPYESEPRGQSYGTNDFELGVDFNQKTAAMVQNPTNEPAGTIVIDTSSRHLYLVQPSGGAIQYGIGVGRQGFAWKGVARVGHKSEWPRWIPPKEMLKRRPDLPEEMGGGLENPLGARALYLFQGNKDTLFRIHGTNEPDSIGKAVSSGCIRMMNADAIDLYKRVKVGTRVVVL
ncbi:MAG: L,D-transpeptidase [Methylocella sp.]|nr:MAG: L,D-transpeptidase [Hyphomicrobiales bacterium]